MKVIAGTGQNSGELYVKKAPKRPILLKGNGSNIYS
jgi:hypothetical protein